MRTERTDLTVFARDYPEARLVLEVKPVLSSPPQEDPAVKQVMRYMWGANTSTQPPDPVPLAFRPPLARPGG
jgi:hypothetical protein